LTTHLLMATVQERRSCLLHRISTTTDAMQCNAEQTQRKKRTPPPANERKYRLIKQQCSSSRQSVGTSLASRLQVLGTSWTTTAPARRSSSTPAAGRSGTTSPTDRIRVGLQAPDSNHPWVSWIHPYVTLHNTICMIQFPFGFSKVPPPLSTLTLRS
jgi:hypothetical protein